MTSIPSPSINAFPGSETAQQCWKNFGVFDGELTTLCRLEKEQRWGPVPLLECPSLEVMPDVMLTIGTKVHPKSLPSFCKLLRFLTLLPQAEGSNCCLRLHVGGESQACLTLEVTAPFVEARDTLKGHLVLATAETGVFTTGTNGISLPAAADNNNVTLTFVTNKCPYCLVPFSKLDTLEAHIRDYCAVRRKIASALLLQQQQQQHDLQQQQQATPVSTTPLNKSSLMKVAPMSNTASAGSSTALNAATVANLVSLVVGGMSQQQQQQQQGASVSSSSQLATSPSSSSANLNVPEVSLPASMMSAGTSSAPLLQMLLQSAALGCAIDWMKLISTSTEGSPLPVPPVTSNTNPRASSNVPSLVPPTAAPSPSPSGPPGGGELLKYCADCDLFFTSAELYQWHVRLTPDYVNSCVLAMAGVAGGSGGEASLLNGGTVRLCTPQWGTLEIPIHTPGAFSLRRTSATSASPMVVPSSSFFSAASTSPASVIASNSATLFKTNGSGTTSASIHQPALPAGNFISPNLLTHPSFALLQQPTANLTQQQQQDQMLRILAAAARLNSSTLAAANSNNMNPVSTPNPSTTPNSKSQTMPSVSTNNHQKRTFQPNQRATKGQGSSSVESSTDPQAATVPVSSDSSSVGATTSLSVPEKKYPCPFCEASFSHPGNLRAHRLYYCVPLQPHEENTKAVQNMDLHQQQQDGTLNFMETSPPLTTASSTGPTSVLTLRGLFPATSVASGQSAGVESAHKPHVDSVISNGSSSSLVMETNGGDVSLETVIDVVSSVPAMQRDIANSVQENKHQQHPQEESLQTSWMSKTYSNKRLKLSPDSHTMS